MASSCEEIMRLVTGQWVSRSLYVAAKLGVAEAVTGAPAKPVEIAYLAERVGAHEESLYRLLRALASVSVFAEVEDKKFDLTPLAMFLLPDNPMSLKNAIIMYGEETYKCWELLPKVLTTGNSTFTEALGMPHFDWYEAHPDASHNFSLSMKGLGRTLYSDSSIIEAMERDSLLLGPEQCVIVDVGGAYATLLSQILQGRNWLRGISYDLPGVTASAQKYAASIDPTISSRLSFISGDFFASVPPGNIFILKRIIHDWQDAQAEAILRNVAQALLPGGKVLIIETVIPKGNDFYFGKWLDVHMMTVTGGKERTEEEFSVLCHNAGLKYVALHKTSSVICIVEATKQTP